MRRLALSILLGCLAGPTFVVVACVMDVMGIRFSILSPVLIASITLFSILLFGLMRMERREKQKRKSRIIVSTIVFVTFAILSIMYTANFFAIGPRGERIPMYHLMFCFKYDNTTVASYPWRRIRWNTYEPPCYTVKYSSGLDGHSLKVACFYYGLPSIDPFTILKFYINKILCDIDSEKAYRRYRNVLIGSGFEIVKKGRNEFMAMNETTLIYCWLDGKYLSVVEVGKDERNLFDKIIISKSNNFSKIDP